MRKKHKWKYLWCGRWEEQVDRFPTAPTLVPALSPKSMPLDNYFNIICWHVENNMLRNTAKVIKGSTFLRAKCLSSSSSQCLAFSPESEKLAPYSGERLQRNSTWRIQDYLDLSIQGWLLILKEPFKVDFLHLAALDNLLCVGNTLLGGLWPGQWGNLKINISAVPPQFKSQMWRFHRWIIKCEVYLYHKTETHNAHGGEKL